MKKRGRLRARTEPPERTAIIKGNNLLRSPWSLIPLAIVIAVCVLVLTAPNNEDDPDGPSGTGTIYNEVGLPLENITGETSFYTYKGDGPEVRFFAAIGDDGLPRVALDACDVCYKNNLGFHQVNATMRCSSCGKTFPLEAIGSANLPGGCWPSFVPYELQDGMVIIDSRFLDTKEYMFE